MLNTQKYMNSISKLTVLLGVILLAGCAPEQVSVQKLIIHGEITLTGEDIAPDFSGTRLFVVYSTDNAQRDTIFYAETDIDGRFSTVATLSSRGVYPMIVTRNDRVVHITNVVLAPSDTLQITGSIPELDRNIRLSSRENQAMQTYERLQRLYGRVATIAYGGGVSQDTIPVLMNQWSDLFWSMREEYPNTYAAELASIDAVEVLEGWNDDKVLERLDELGNDDAFFPVKLIYGGHLRARMQGLDVGVAYLDRLRGSVSDQTRRSAADVRVIELLAEYGEFDRVASETVARQRRNRDDAEFMAWSEAVLYEIGNLIPGRTLPAFSFGLNAADTISTASLAGTYFMLEFVLLADENYQASYPLLVSLHRNIPDGLVDFYSVPLDRRQLTVNGFFEERARRWKYADAGAFDQSELGNILRIDQVPTRYLINRDGTIISRYIGHDLSGLSADLQTIIETLN
jgi:hypothetical protein